MKKLILVFLSTLLFVWRVDAQVTSATTYANTITTEDLRDRLTIIASDALEGRNTGSRGQKMAAAFISDHFRQLGLTAPVNNSYYQPVNLYASFPEEVFLKVGVTTFQNYKEVIYLGSTDSKGEKQLDVVFAGKGTEEDYKNLAVKGKAVLIYHEALSDFNMSELPTLSQLAHEKGAAMILYTADFNREKFLQLGSNLENYLNAEEWSLEKPAPAALDSGSFLVMKEVAEKILNMNFSAVMAAAKSSASTAKVKPGKMNFKVVMKTSTLASENVLGYLEGTDKKDELVIITAHYDHVGKGEGEGDVIYNGADDDGSGTVAVMELAEAFAEAKKNGKGPRRSILFMTMTGEELGLFGSEYYVTHPVYPLTQTVANLNIDMIGRSDNSYEDKSDYVYVIGSDKLSQELHTINEQANQAYTKLVLDYVYNDEAHPERLYYRSDHWNFAKNNIPIIFYFDGIHNDYHQVTDEVSKINFELLAKRTKLVFHTAWEIANREKRLVLDR